MNTDSALPAEAPPGPPHLHIDGPRATITLNRPAHHNRLHLDDLRTLQRQLALLADPARLATLRVLVLAARGPSFCSGFHLGEFDAAAQPAADPGAGPRRFEATVQALAALPLPSLCRLHGPVLGGATDLALACDFRIGVPAVSLRMPAARIGLHYYASGLQRAVQRLGLATAKRLFLLAEPLPAQDLHRLGWLDSLVAAEALDAEVDRLAAALAAGAPLAVQGMKASLDEIAAGNAHLSVLQQREARCAASADLREGRAALAERRPPRFQGR